MRYAQARLLAELPTTAVTNRDLDLLEELERRLIRSKDKVVPAGYTSLNIGEPVGGYQMVYRMKPELIDGPMSVHGAERWGIRSTPGQLQQAIDTGTTRMASTDFGWIRQGEDPDNPMAELIYGPPRRPENQLAARKQKLSQQIKARTPELMDAFGLKPGDLVYNTPVGTNNGDYTRALTYMREGFGAPSYDNQQFAMVTRTGGLEPWQPWGAHPGVGAQMGWNVPLTPAQQEQWEARLANQMAQRLRQGSLAAG